MSSLEDYFLMVRHGLRPDEVSMDPARSTKVMLCAPKTSRVTRLAFKYTSSALMLRGHRVPTARGTLASGHLASYQRRTSTVVGVVRSFDSTISHGAQSSKSKPTSFSPRQCIGLSTSCFTCQYGDCLLASTELSFTPQMQYLVSRVYAQNAEVFGNKTLR